MIFARLVTRKTIITLTLVLIIGCDLYAASSGNIAYFNSPTDKQKTILNNDEIRMEYQLHARTPETDNLSLQEIGQQTMAILPNGTTRLVVGLNTTESDKASSLREIVVENGGTILNSVSIGTKVEAMTIEVPSETVSALMEQLYTNNLATYIEPRTKVQAHFVPNDPYFSIQWGLQKIESEWAWNTTVGSRNILVALVDTGIDYHHPDLAANYVPLGYDWVNEDADPMDDCGHGTHCAGIIAGQMNNSVGIAGIAQVRIMAEKCLDFRGEGNSDWVASGIIHAVDHGARIISMSFGGYEDSEIMHEAIRYAARAGVLLIASAGNDDSDARSYPAAYEEVIAVTATDYADVKASFSNHGQWIELAAPGVGVFSTYMDNDYKTLSGTSMACPHVSGLAALIMSAFQNQTGDFVRFLLRYTADDLGQPGFDPYYGYGRINAENALSSPKKDHELVAFKLATPPYLKLEATNTMNIEVLNLGKTQEHNVLVQVLENNTAIWQRTLDSLASYDTASVSVEWTPTIEGLYNVTLYVAPSPSEENVENNIITRFIYAGSPVKAVIVRPDETKEEILTNWNVLNNQWALFGNRMLYVDYTSLNKKTITYRDIATTEADVLLISNVEQEEFSKSEIDAVQQYVYEGHGLIITGDTFSDNAPNNKRLTQLVGLNADLSLNWYTEGTDMLQTLNTSHPLFNKVPQPLILPVIPTTVPRAFLLRGRWSPKELDGGSYLALGYLNESAIVEYRGLLFISGMLETMPARYHHHLQLLYNAIMYSRYQKSPYDLTASLDCPGYLMPTNTTLLNATVYNTGLLDESNVELYLTVDGTIVNMTTIPKLLSGSSRTITYLWGASVEGKHNVTAYAPPSTNETQELDNAKSKMIYVHYPRLVLWDYTHTDSVGFLQRQNILVTETLKKEGFVIDEIRSTRINRDLLTSYDILVLPTTDATFSESETNDILEWVANGGSIIAVVNTNFDPTLRSLTLPYGVQIFRDNLSPGITRNIADHPITEDVHSIYYATPQLLGTTYPSEAVAWTFRGSNRFDLVTASENGEAIVIGDTHMIDNQGFSRADNEQLITNIFHWLAAKHLHDHDLAITLQSPSFIQKGDTAILNATVRNRGSEDEINIETQIIINGTVIASTEIPYLLSGGLYTLQYTWTPTLKGDYNVTAYVRPTPAENFTSNNRVTLDVPVFFYQLYRFPTKWTEQGEQTGWHASNGSWPYTLPFDFPFYNQRYRTIFISGNGLITFTRPDQSHPESIRALTSMTAISPAWHQWKIEEPYGIYTVQTDLEHVIIRWEVHDENGSSAQFAAQLGHNGVIQFFYGYSNQSASAIIGISNGLGHAISEQTQSLNHIHTLVFAPFEIVHDLGVSLEVPSFIALGNSVILNATVTNKGLANETDVCVRLAVNDSRVESTRISELDTDVSNRTSWLWNPPDEGQYNITAFAPPLQEETYAGNNVESKIVYVLANTTTYVSVNPPTSTIAVGANFTVNMIVTGVRNLYTWQVKLHFDPLMLKCLEVWLPPNNIFAYSTPLFPEPLIEEDYATIGATLLGNTPTFAGCGILCKVKFHAETLGNGTIVLDTENTYLLNSQMDTINSTIVNGLVEALPGDFNNDGIISMSDLMILVQSYGAHAGEERWNTMYDLNGDSKIDMTDIAILARMLGEFLAQPASKR